MTGHGGVAENEARVNEVYRLLLSGNDRHTILRYAAARGWGVCDRQVDRYIAKAQAELTTYNKLNRDQMYAKAMRKLDDLYAKAYAAADYKTCLAVQRESNDISGLHEEHVDVSVDGGVTVVIGEEFAGL